MTDPRLALAEAISRANGIRMGFEGASLHGFVACDRHYWTEPLILDPILAAARAVVAGEVRANYPGLDGEPCERFEFDWSGPFNRALARGHDHSSAACIADEAEERARKKPPRGKGHAA